MSEFLPGFGEITTRERAIYDAGRAYEQAQAPAETRDRPGWLTSEFALTVATTLFAMWVGYRLVVDPQLDLERGGAVIAAVLGAAWFYTRSRTEMKKPDAPAVVVTSHPPAVPRR